MYHCEIMVGDEVELRKFDNYDKLTALDFHVALEWAEKLATALSVIANHGSGDGSIPTQVVSVYWKE